MSIKNNHKRTMPFFLLFPMALTLFSCGGAKKVTITFDANGGAFADGSTYQIQTTAGTSFYRAIFDMKMPTIKNQAFDYWTINNQKIDASYKVNDNITVKANYFTPIKPEEIAENGIVLLKNKDEALPLNQLEKSTKTLNVFGFGGSRKGWYFQGNGSGTGTKDGRIHLVDALTQNGFKINESLEHDYEQLNISNVVQVTEDPKINYTIRETSENFVKNHLDKITDEKKNIALVVFSRYGGEGNDLPKFQAKQIQDVPDGEITESTDTSKNYSALTNEENASLNAICNSSKFSKIIVLLNCCCPMECGFLDNDKIDAAFYMPVAGNKGTLAVPKVLDGSVNPSGRLADTFAYSLKTAPSYFNMSYENNFDDRYKVRKFADHPDDYIHYTCYEENIYIGYYWYETADKMGYWNNEPYKGYNSVVQYPFGFGKSYTNFKWEMDGEPRCSSGTLLSLTYDTEITFKVKVTNIGNRSGKDVVQLYVEKPYTKGGIEKPAIQLIGFAKTKELLPGETEELVLKTRIADFADYDVYDSNNDGFMGYELDRGDYIFSLRTDVHTKKAREGFSWSGEVPSTFHYEKDMDTNYEIKNRFTTCTTKSGETSTNNDKHPIGGRCGSIDGSDFGKDRKGIGAKYLSRSDFAGTMPSGFLKAPILGAKNDKNADYYQTWKVLDPWQETVEAPKQNQPGNLKLDDVMDKKYDDPLWNKLLDQLTVDEMKELVRLGGFKTLAIERINKKATVDKDGPCGFAPVDGVEATPTNFPSDSMVACTWDQKMAYSFGKALGYEATNILGINGNYGPGLNIHRSPLGGRNFEYYSEDPFLSGNLCSWQISGAKEESMYCYVKHVALNDSDAGRNGRYNFATEQAFRQIYAKPFEIVSKGAKVYSLDGSTHQALKANAMMASVDRIGTTRVTGSYNFLTEVIRNEWGFNGMIITDYYQSGDVNDIDEGIRSGNDLMLSGSPNCNYDDDSSNTFKYYVRKAAKNILYTYINTRYEGLTHSR